MDATGLVTYTAVASFCNSTDNFRYVLCNGVGCDTALVTVMVRCDMDTTGNNVPFKIYTGFSPNGDDFNKTFVIDNARQYPDHIVRVYNRWGVKVMEAEDYQNDWPGTWQDRELPDGVYFYMFDTGTGTIFKGALTIRR